MAQFLSVLPECTAAAVFLLPQFCWLHKTRFHSMQKSVLCFLFALYLAAVYAVAGLPTAFSVRFDPHYNLTPFLYMFSAHRTSLLNILLFVPLGFFLVILHPGFRKPLLTVCAGFLVSVLIESMQLFTFRATDINDLMTNTLGTFLGYLLGKWFLYRFPSIRPNCRKKELAAVCISVFLTMFFLKPGGILLLRFVLRSLM